MDPTPGPTITREEAHRRALAHYSLAEYFGRRYGRNHRAAPDRDDVTQEVYLVLFRVALRRPDLTEFDTYAWTAARREFSTLVPHLSFPVYLPEGVTRDLTNPAVIAATADLAFPDVLDQIIDPKAVDPQAAAAAESEGEAEAEADHRPSAAERLAPLLAATTENRRRALTLVYGLGDAPLTCRQAAVVMNSTRSKVKDYVKYALKSMRGMTTEGY